MATVTIAERDVNRAGREGASIVQAFGDNVNAHYVPLLDCWNIEGDLVEIVRLANIYGVSEVVVKVTEIEKLAQIVLDSSKGRR